MHKRVAVIGLGYFGRRIALELTDRGAEVIVIDNTMSKIEEISDKVAYAVRLDSTDDNSLRKQGLSEMDAIIVSIGENFESALLTCVHLLSHGCKRIVVKSTSPVHTKIFRRIGIEEIVSPDEVMADRLAASLVNDSILDSIPLADEYRILEVKAPAFMIGKTLLEIGMRKNYELNLITIMRSVSGRTGKDKKEIIGVPMPDTQILADDVLVLMGHEKNIKKILDSQD